MFGEFMEQIQTKNFKLQCFLIDLNKSQCKWYSFYTITVLHLLQIYRLCDLIWKTYWQYIVAFKRRSKIKILMGKKIGEATQAELGFYSEYPLWFNFFGSLTLHRNWKWSHLPHLISFFFSHLKNRYWVVLCATHSSEYWRFNPYLQRRILQSVG